MIARVQVIIVLDTFRLQLPVEFRGALIKPQFIVTAAIEIDLQPRIPYPCPVLLCQNERAVLIPTLEVNGVAEHRSQEPTQGCGARRSLSLPWRLGEKRSTLRADRGE